MTAHQIQIVWPPAQTGGLTIHLYLAGFQPGRKTRDFDGAMCGIAANTERWRIKDHTLPQAEWEREYFPNGRWHQPFVEGFEFVQPPWRWCSICLGRAINHLDLAADVARLIAAKETVQ